MGHLTVEVMLEYIEGSAASDGLANTEAHLSACAHCQEQVVELRDLVGFLAEDRGNEPPPAVLREAVELFQPVLQPNESPTQRVLRIARRVFDSYQQPLEGVRNIGTVPRQLLFRSGDVDVDLRIQADAGRVTLSGQLLSGAESFPADTRVRLEAGGAVRFSTSTNAVGEFSFDTVPDDTYHLALELPQGELRLFCVNQTASA